MTNTLIIYYNPYIQYSSIFPLDKNREVRSAFTTLIEPLLAIITDTSYNMDSHLTRNYPRLARYSICLSTCIVLCKIPLFLGHNLYNMKKYLTKKYYKYIFIYYTIYLIKQKKESEL